MKLAPPISCSNKIKNNVRVAHIYAEIKRELDTGNGPTIDQCKQLLAAHSKKIAEKEVEARRFLQAFKHYQAIHKISGLLVINVKGTNKFDPPKSSIVNLAYAATKSAKRSSMMSTSMVFHFSQTYVFLEASKEFYGEIAPVSFLEKSVRSKYPFVKFTMRTKLIVFYRKFRTSSFYNIYTVIWYLEVKNSRFFLFLRRVGTQGI